MRSFVRNFSTASHPAAPVRGGGTACDVRRDANVAAYPPAGVHLHSTPVIRLGVASDEGRADIERRPDLANHASHIVGASTAGTRGRENADLLIVHAAERLDTDVELLDPHG